MAWHLSEKLATDGGVHPTARLSDRCSFRTRDLILLHLSRLRNKILTIILDRQNVFAVARSEAHNLDRLREMQTSLENWQLSVTRSLNGKNYEEE